MGKKIFTLLGLMLVFSQTSAANLDLSDLCPKVEDIQYGTENGQNYAFAYNHEGKYFKTGLLSYHPLIQWFERVSHYPENKQLTCTYRAYTTSHPVHQLPFDNLYCGFRIINWYAR